MVELSPSILSADFSNIGNILKNIKSEKLKMIHLDVMDGVFVPNITFGFKFIEDIKKITDYFFDVHLMVYEPIRFIEKFKNSGADLITVHLEACKNVNETLDKINSLNIKSGLAINPDTKIECIYKYLNKIDFALIMSVNPGFGGQKFIENTHDKIINLKEFIKKNNLKTKIEVDGGIKTLNVKSVIDDGAEVIVSGSDIFNNDVNKKIEEYYNIFDI
ncbi:MAG: ribulose-phosphate 3-epimerase [Peptoniphilaceae bacterium]|nr:ribulose-phosphate 3-epimerase [Peptoniphilaceae bacterium]MDY3738191.1 ribulose-phosphate 3-epimerase [Peptoniphilaceae bacterium]